MSEQDITIRFFFYGTLMRGESQHGLVAPWLVHVESARVWGRLFQLEAGYPAMEVPEESILSIGTEDGLLDAATGQWRAAHPLKMHGGDWGWVHGEMVEIRDPRRCVPPLDTYEDFRPGGNSLFQRVLIPAAGERDTMPAWTYIRTTGSDGKRLHAGVWIP